MLPPPHMIEQPPDSRNKEAHARNQCLHSLLSLLLLLLAYIRGFGQVMLTTEAISEQMPEYELRMPPMPCENSTTGNGSALSKMGACCNPTGSYNF